MRFYDYIIPPICPLCRAPITGERDFLCKKCRMDWEVEKEICRRYHLGTAVRAFDDDAHERAGYAIHLVEYDPQDQASIVKPLITCLKYTRATRISEYIGRELAGLITEERVLEIPGEFIITWVPRTPRRILKYGLDHMKRVALYMSRLLGIEHRSLLLRSVFSREQKELDKNQRRYSANRSIHIRKNIDITGKNVILVDDIITTGASMEVCSKRLLEAGARSVIGVTLASTNRRFEKSESRDELKIKFN